MCEARVSVLRYTERYKSMSVAGPVGGEAFTLRIFKQLSTNPALTWVNNYECAIPAGGSATMQTLVGFADVVLQFERAIHLHVVQFTKSTLSTWTPDSKPYNPASFLTIDHPADTIGTRPLASSEAQPVAMALKVRRSVSTGRQGRVMYRGCLTEADVISTSGVPTFFDPQVLVDLVDNAVASSGIDDYFGASSTGLRMYLITKDGTNRRTVNGFVVSGVTFVQTDHKYFNRSNA